MQQVIQQTQVASLRRPAGSHRQLSFKLIRNEHQPASVRLTACVLVVDHDVQGVALPARSLLLLEVCPKTSGRTLDRRLQND